MSQRSVALEILYKTINDESYSNLLMRKKLNELIPIQRAFCTNLVNGVLRKYEILEYQYKDEIKNNTPLKIKLTLSMALYERFFLNEKDYVVNNEYVSLGDNKYDKSFINALLRKITVFKQSGIEHIDACLPEWLYKLLKAQYDEDNLKKIINIYQSTPKLYYRLNKHKANISELKKYDIEMIDEDIFICNKNLLNTDEYAKGYFYIQDFNSASLYRHLDLNKDDSLLDVCSAPGSKLFNCLDIIKPENAYANDVNGKRVELISKMATKLGFEGINYINYDGRIIKDKLDKKFDRIMLDAPCSGLGVIGRKPDLKFHVSPTSLDELEKLQYELLESMDTLLKTEGILLYSTCTLNKKENASMIKKFIGNNDKYILLEDESIINESGDAFYYAKLKKVK